MSRLTGESLKTHCIRLAEFSENLTLQPQVSNIPTDLVYSLIDNPAMHYILGFCQSMYIEI